MWQLARYGARMWTRTTVERRAKRGKKRGVARRGAAALALVLALAACSGDDDGGAGSGGDERPETEDASVPAGVEHHGPRSRATSADGTLTVETTSARADMVTDGDVLVTLSGDGAADATVTLGGEDVTTAFGDAAGGTRRGLIGALVEGENELVATTGDASAGEVHITVVNHPKNGPVFSGPHLEPWLCKTEQFGLGAPLDDDCDAETRTTWRYVRADDTLVELDDPSIVPDDAATTTTAGGDEVPFVVRLEQGVIDRGIYSIAVLDPNPQPDASSWDGDAWNERLVYRFGGGCGTNYSQASGLVVSDVLDVDLLGAGYAVATNTLDVFQTACHDVLSAEAMMMTRERFVERYGVPEYTIGDGGSGGAIQQLLIAQNYPGLLDALSPSVPFPDAATIAGGVTDCGLLVEYFESERGSSLTPEQQTAITGHASTGTCAMWKDLFLGAIDPTTGCDPELPTDAVYDPDANPDGARCTLQDVNVNVFGRDPDTGFARRALDNVGIQYGLGALADGAITVDEFLDLNEFVGGWDIDGVIRPERTEATEETISVAYRTGRVTGEGALQDLPIILRNVYTDDAGDIHTRYQAFSIRERLRIDGEDNPNVLLWTSPSGEDLIGSLVGSIGDANEPIRILDEWLTSGERPADAQNRCSLPDGTVLDGGWELYDEPGPCADAYPVHGDPRLVAGQSIAQAALKCTLTQAEREGYGVELTDDQWERLQAIFPDGVCDWSVPGVGQVEPDGTWQRFGDG